MEHPVFGTLFLEKKDVAADFFLKVIVQCYELHKRNSIKLCGIGVMAVISDMHVSKSRQIKLK